ncbi:hypothetical protein NBRC10512_000176 [Rhodotorula toruloides]|uniref:RHTO0S28e01838g1_1 n=2 Tax=Rhodotorula toruloides TaxID=5286 RepID=A0A061BNR3_RHOTO|nr:uncharacterized protein RHTO_05718 [Rhodotorula toruloides NP11]EMS18615.1 hypothetical protein RHTO_05718 [Rhodotorula toruloides NP11]CDR49620.1 RHTO0S28e01838g1_1 [Rhodotorula toruloides]
MPSGNSTDYDSLPSPRGGSSHSAARPKKLYGRKAARIASGRGAQEEEDGGKGIEKSGKRRRPVREAGRFSEESDFEARREAQKQVKRRGREKGELVKGGEGKKRSAKRVEEGDVESNDETEAEPSKRPLAKKAKTDASSAQPRSSQPQPVQSRWRADQALQDAENALVEKKRRKESKKDVEVVVEIPARRPSSGNVPPSATATSADDVVPSITLRKPALLDKSNLTTDSPRSAARPLQASRSPLRPAPSTALLKRRGSTLAVYRDETATTSKPLSPQGGSTSTATMAAQNLRLPRAAGGWRLGSEPPPAIRSLPSPTFATFDRLLPRSPRSAGNASPLRSLSPLRSAPLLGVPRAAESALPAPWALSAPASASNHPSSSPQNPPADAPVFHFTTTEFGDLPSIRLSLGSNAETGDGREGGMDSTIVLETWEEGVRDGRREESPMHGVEEEEEVDGERTMRPQSTQGREEAEETVIERKEAKETATDQDQTDVAVGISDMSLDDGDVTVTAAIREVQEQDHGQRTSAETTAAASPEQQDDADDVAMDETVSLDQHSIDANEDEEKPVSRCFPRPLFWTSDFMPPRHPRPPVDPPLPDGPPSSEDELAYYLRTTGTYSSEDDLPPIGDAPSDDSAREDWLAEREIGRAVKPTSGQRAKRIKASEARRKLERLRIDGGKRSGTKREILPLDQVRIPKRVRRLIEQQAYERGAEADDELDERQEDVEEVSVGGVEAE